MGQNILLKYNLKTKEFVKVGEKPLWTFQAVIGDWLVGYSEYSGRLSVLDLKTDDFLVYDEVLDVRE